MNEQAMRFRVGVFVLGTTVLLGVLIVLFAGLPSLLKKHHSYTVIVSEAPGVSPGTPVRRSGVRIGEVGKVQLDDATSQVRVELLLDKKYVLHQGDQVAVVQGILGGDALIDISAPLPDDQAVERPRLDPGSELKGRVRPDVGSVLGQTTQLQEALTDFRELARTVRDVVPELRRTNDEILVLARNWNRVGERTDVLLQTNEERLVKTIDSLNTTVTRAGNWLNDDNQRNFASILKNTEASSQKFDAIATNGNELIKEARQMMGRFNETLRRTDELLTSLQQVAKPLGERGPAIVKNMDESMEKLGRTMTDVRELLRAITNGDGTFQRLMADPSLFNNLNETAAAVYRMVPRLERILRDAEVFADKIARHPELIGVRGAIIPNSGLKAVPPNDPPYPRH